MFEIIRGSLDRQTKALVLLQDLLSEEFSLLVERNTDAIMSLEFSIHELLRQVAVEKETVIRSLGGGKVRDYAQMLPDVQRAELESYWTSIDQLEQNSARQATLNTELSLGLLDQSETMLNYLHSHLAPPSQNTYGRRGRYAQSRPEAALMSRSL